MDPFTTAAITSAISSVVPQLFQGKGGGGGSALPGIQQRQFAPFTPQPLNFTGGGQQAPQVPQLPQIPQVAAPQMSVPQMQIPPMQMPQVGGIPQVAPPPQVAGVPQLGPPPEPAQVPQVAPPPQMAPLPNVITPFQQIGQMPDTMQQLGQWEHMPQLQQADNPDQYTQLLAFLSMKNLA